jgi:hypothetical protein
MGMLRAEIGAVQSQKSRSTQSCAHAHTRRPRPHARTHTRTPPARVLSQTARSRRTREGRFSRNSCGVCGVGSCGVAARSSTFRGTLKFESLAGTKFDVAGVSTLDPIPDNETARAAVTSVTEQSKAARRAMVDVLK